MTRIEINEMVGRIADAVDLPWCYHHFEEPQEPPYLIYLISRNDFYADDKNYQKIARVAIEYYYDEADPEREELIESLLPEAYTASEPVYLESEQMYEIIYEMEVPYGQ